MEVQVRTTRSVSSHLPECLLSNRQQRSVGEDVVQWEHWTLWVGMQFGAATVEDSMDSWGTKWGILEAEGRGNWEGAAAKGSRVLAPGRPGTPPRPRRGIASPVAIRSGDRAQRKRCRDPRCSPRGNPACRGTFGGRRKAVRDRFALQAGGLRPLVELCVEPAGLCGRCTGPSTGADSAPSELSSPFAHCGCQKAPGQSLSTP